MILLGNIVSLIGSLVLVLIGLIKRKEHVLIAQCFQFGIMSVSNLILGGITGALLNFVSMVRNLIGYKFGITTPIKIVVIVIQVVLSLMMNNLGLIGLLPVISVSVFTWFIDMKSDLGMKLLLLVTTFPWIISDLTTRNYVSVLFDVAFVCANCIGIYRIKKGETERTVSEK